ncbi:MAG: 30S ribosome-binding factor RbfA [Candidatus Aegiribacteria sp.]|nr:30S ribosome-binding factor RbfA [Candidatus Aegiribacteria sp.]
MEERRRQRLEVDIREDVGEILSRDISDERLKNLSVTRVKLSRDGSNATLFFEISGAEEEQQEAFEAMESAKGYLRSKLASMIQMRTVPILSFVKDDSGKKGDRVLNIMRELDTD